MASIKQGMRERGVGAYLRVETLVQSGVKEFEAVIVNCKQPSKGTPGAAFIMMLDATPVEEREITINVSNANRCVRFLQAIYQSDDYDFLEGAIVTFRVKELKGFVDGDPEAVTYGLEIAALEPMNPEDGEMMYFDAPSKVEDLSPAVEPKWKASRARLEERRQAQAEAREKKLNLPATDHASTKPAKKRK